MDDRDRQLAELAARQRGLVSRAQSLALGLPHHSWAHRVERGDWIAATQEVWLRAGAPWDERAATRAASLHFGPGTAISHHCAGSLWKLPGCGLWPLHVSVPRSACNGVDRPKFLLPTTFPGGPAPRDARVIVHRPTQLPSDLIGVLDGVPIARPPLVLLQLAPWVAPQRLQRLLDSFWRRRLTSGPSIELELEPLMGRGRAGVVALRALLDRCGPDYVPPDSNLESRLNDIVNRAGFPPLQKQTNLGDTQRWLGRVDLYWPLWLIIIEVDSDMYHSALSDLEDDAERQAALERAGYLVVRFSEFEVWHREAVVAARLREAIREVERRNAVVR